MDAGTRRALNASLGVMAFASLSLGVTSHGARGLVLGLLVPGICVGVISMTQGLLPAFGVCAIAWLAGVKVADSVGNNLTNVNINLWPLFYVAGLLLAACVGLFLGLALESARDNRRFARTATAGRRCNPPGAR
jgi:hypothetical protein